MSSEVLPEPLHTANIGESDILSIGQSYTLFRHTERVPKKPTIRTFWQRVEEALIDAAQAGKTYKGTEITPTQTMAAKIAGVKQPTVSDWNKPGKAPELTNGRKLAQELDVCVEWLYEERGPKRPGRPEDPIARQLWDLWPRLNPEARGAVLGYAEAKAAPIEQNAETPFDTGSPHR